MKQAKESSFRFLCAAAKILPEFAAIAAAVAAIFFDVIVLRQRCSESCLVEWCQFAAILSSGLILLAAAVRDRENDAGLMLAAILFLDMAIREQDAALDCIFHGFWTIPVGILTGFALFYACFRHDAAISGLEKIAACDNFAELAIGLLIILFFSRMIGYKMLWRAFGVGDTIQFCKRFVEESLELLGYLLILVWSLRFFFVSSKPRYD